jgi:hypothetical protein
MELMFRRQGQAAAAIRPWRGATTPASCTQLVHVPDSRFVRDVALLTPFRSLSSSLLSSALVLLRGSRLLVGVAAVVVVMVALTGAFFLLVVAGAVVVVVAVAVVFLPLSSPPPPPPPQPPPPPPPSSPLVFHRDSFYTKRVGEGGCGRRTCCGLIVLPSSPLCVALELLVGTAVGVGVVHRRLIEYHCNCVLSPSWVGGAAARRFHLYAFCWFNVDLLL